MAGLHGFLNLGESILEFIEIGPEVGQKLLPIRLRYGGGLPWGECFGVRCRLFEGLNQRNIFLLLGRIGDLLGELLGAPGQNLHLSLQWGIRFLGMKERDGAQKCGS